MADQPDDLYKNLSGKLSEVFTALDKGLKDAKAKGRVPTAQDRNLEVIVRLIRPQLDAQMQQAKASNPATWRLANLAHEVIQAEIPAQRNAAARYQPVRDANKALGKELQATRASARGSETLVQLAGLINQLPGQLTQSLPGTIAAAVIAALGQPPGNARMPQTPADLANASARVSLYVQTSEDAIAFLSAALTVLQAAQQSAAGIPQGLVSPITNVILEVFNVVALSATIQDLNTMIELKQKITAVLVQAAGVPAQPGPVAAGSV